MNFIVYVSIHTEKCILKYAHQCYHKIKGIGSVSIEVKCPRFYTYINSALKTYKVRNLDCTAQS